MSKPQFFTFNGVCLPANPESSTKFPPAEGWIVMQRKILSGCVSFYQNWAAYRDGFGSPTYDNYWLGLGKVHSLMKRGVARLGIEV